MNETAESMENAKMNMEQNAAAQEADTPTENSVDVDAMSDADFEAYLAGEYGAGSDEASNDTDGQATEPSTAQSEAEEAEEAGKGDGKDSGGDAVAQPYKSFASQEEWQSTIDRIIGDRLKTTRAAMKEYDALKRTITDYYGIEDADRAVQMLLGDMTEQAAASRGIDAQTYRRLQESEQQNREYAEQLRQAQQREQMAAQRGRVAAIQSDWQRQADALCRTVSDFDLNAYMQNKEFVGYVVERGLSIADAYYLVNRTQQMQKAQQKAEAKKDRQPVHENGASRAMGGSTYSDVSKMSDADFEKYLERLM